MASLIRAPSKLFWQIPLSPTLGHNHYVCLDQVMGELTCSTCYYQCYGRKRMERHIIDKHSAEDKSQEIPSGSEANEKEIPAKNVESSHLGFYVEDRATDESEKMEVEVSNSSVMMEQPDQSESSYVPDITSSFHCRDPVLGELICDYCHYTSFNKSTMIKHLKNKHETTTITTPEVAVSSSVDEAVFEVPPAISPIPEKHVTFAEDDTIIPDFSLDISDDDNPSTSSDFKPVVVEKTKKPFIYDGSDILEKLFAMEP